MTRINKIVAACHLDDQNAAVLRCAAALAENQEAELHLLHVVVKKGSRRNAAEETRHARERLEMLLPADQIVNLTVRWEVRQGAVGKTIVDYAEEAGVDMIVMGSHRRGILARVVSTSKPSQVLKVASCPVVIVPVDREPTPATLLQIVEVLRETFGEFASGDRQAARVRRYPRRRGETLASR